MRKQNLLRGIGLVLILVALTTTALAAEPVRYTMKVHEGFICVQDAQTGSWIYQSQVRADTLSQRDQFLLKAGIPLYSQADFTSAVEDFCS